MKKLLGLLAAAVFVPAVANADVLQNVTLKGEIQTIASDVKHNTTAPAVYSRGTSARVLAGLSADLVEDVTANVMFQYNNVWGNDISIGRTAQDYLNDVRLVEANLVLRNLFDCFEATVGRQFYGSEDSAVMYFGPNHYNAQINAFVSAFDAAKVTYADDFKSVTVLAGRVNQSHVFLPSTKTYNMYGADVKLNLSDDLTAQAYAYDMKGADLVDYSHVGFYGTKLALNAPVRLSAEYARNFAGNRLVKEPKGTGQMIKVDAAADINAMTVRGTFYYANANFYALGNYTPGLLIGHNLGGDLVGFTSNNAAGIALFNLGLDVKPADKWTVSVDGFSFQDAHRKHAAVLELDVTAKYAHNEHVELFAGVGYASYPKYFVDASKEFLGFSDNVKGQLGMLVKF